jgi:hypothetical protein
MIEPPPAAIIGLHPEKRAGEVDVDDALPVRQFEFLQHVAVDDAGVVHQHIQPAELADRRVPLVRLGDVEVHEARRLAEFVGQRLALVIENVSVHHLGALA